VSAAVALVLCLNIGVDPPDVIKISPCARLECWVDPLSMQPAKALETIGEQLPCFHPQCAAVLAGSSACRQQCLQAAVLAGSSACRQQCLQAAGTTYNTTMLRY
jgi:hypothetical protein